VNSLTGALTPVASSQCTRTQVDTVTDVSYQPQPPTYQQGAFITTPGQPVTIPGQPTTSFQPQQPVSVQLPPTTQQIFTPQVIPSQYNVASVTASPIAFTGASSNVQGANFDFGSISINLATPVPQAQFVTVPGQMQMSPRTPLAITVPGQPFIQPGQPVIQPGSPIAVPQAPVAVPVPRVTTRQVPACANATEPCALPICYTFVGKCQNVGACGTQTCGQQTDTRARTCTCTRQPDGVTVDNSNCGASFPAYSTAEFARTPCPTLPCCFQYTCQLGSFSQCSTTCGQGQMTRTAQCIQTCVGQAGSTVVNATRCAASGTCAPSSQPCTICPANQGPPSYTPVAPVYLPGPTITQQGQTIQVPGQTIQQPGQTIQLPGQTVVVPGQTIVQPGQTFVMSAPPQNPVFIPQIVPIQATPQPTAFTQTSYALQPFAVTNYGASSCPAGYFEITSEATCRSAAQFVNFQAGAQFSGSWAGQPAGCIYDNNGFEGYPAGVYFNNIPSFQGVADPNTARLCTANFGGRRSQHAAASAVEQPQRPSALVVVLGSVVAVVAIFASGVVVFNKVVNKVVDAEWQRLTRQ